jgi:short-subunit dehydrogenase
MRFKSLNEQVLVITGATSGIGLATARAAVRRGAMVVLAARDGEGLTRVHAELNRATGRVGAVVADVSQPDQVDRIVSFCVETFGGFDTWINNAGVSIYGPTLDVPFDDQRQLFDINYWGVVYGSTAAVRHLSQRGGVLVNLGSIVSDRALPLQAAYCASKHAVKGFTDALRMEVEREGWPVAICLVKPAAIDTPFFDHARNYMDRRPVAPPPVYPAEEVARAILSCAERPMRDVTVGGAGRAITLGAAIAPRMTDYYMEKLMFRAQQGEEDAPRDGNLYDSTPPHLERGTQRRVLGSSAYTRAKQSSAARMLPVMALGLAAVAATRAWGRS